MKPHFPLAAQIVAVARESGGPLTRAGLEPERPYRGLCNDGPSVASGGQEELIAGLPAEAERKEPGWCASWRGVPATVART